MISTNLASGFSEVALESIKSKTDAEIVSELTNFTDATISVLTLIPETKEDCIPDKYKPILNSTILSIYPELKGKINGLFKAKNNGS